MNIKKYLLYSQRWPISNYHDMPTTTWTHRLNFYIPKQINYPKVLLYVGGGSNKDQEGQEKYYSSKEQIDYAAIANRNHAIVVELQDVPNQHLFFDGHPVKEDQILAYTYRRFMDDPMQNAYLPGHLPMAKAIVKAMDAVYEIVQHEYHFDVTGFVLTGASKRGWAVWLAALGDNRVDAIVPIVIDVLNTQQSIKHVCAVYGGACPLALKDYVNQGITDLLFTPMFNELMQVEDPYSYLQDNYDNNYKARLKIPKYIINASGDDFFAPDSSRWYFKKLPGDNNYIRYLPNAMHYFRGNFISDSTDSLGAINEALNSYFYFILHNTGLPKVNWMPHGDSIEVTSSIKPSLVKLWLASNTKTRDFRLLSSYSRWHLLIKKIKSYFTTAVCDNCYQEQNIPVVCKEINDCKIYVDLPAVTQGWQASFLELHYNIDGHCFIITTEINVTPDIMPKVKESKDY